MRKRGHPLILAYLIITARKYDGEGGHYLLEEDWVTLNLVLKRQPEELSVR